MPVLKVAHLGTPVLRQRSKEVDPAQLKDGALAGFLRDMEMIKQVEMMQDLSQVEQGGDPGSENRLQKPLPTKKKEAAK